MFVCERYLASYIYLRILSLRQSEKRKSSLVMLPFVTKIKSSEGRNAADNTGTLQGMPGASCKPYHISNPETNTLTPKRKGLKIRGVEGRGMENAELNDRKYTHEGYSIATANKQSKRVLSFRRSTDVTNAESVASDSRQTEEGSTAPSSSNL